MSSIVPSGKGTYYYGEGDFGLPHKPSKAPAFSRPSNRDVWSIGFDNMWDIMERMSRVSSSSTYPPYNIIREEDDFSVEVAVAGFAREDLTITIEDNLLKIEGMRPPVGSEYVHKGIGARNFTHKFLLGEYVEVKDATLENGILTVELFRNVPEDKKPKRIEIH